jgi:hypothetical protein
MKAFVVALTAASMLAGLAVPLDAAPQRKRYKKHARVQTNIPQAYVPSTGSRSDYAVHDSNSLPFGSSLWWEQKGREGGGGSGSRF